jgi:hypothetical protein
MGKVTRERVTRGERGVLKLRHALIALRIHAVAFIYYVLSNLIYNILKNIF